MKKTPVALAVAVVISPVLLAGSAAMAFNSYEAAGCASVPETDAAAVAEQVRAVLDGNEEAAGGSEPGLSDPQEQVPNALAIVTVGVELGIPARGHIIALATAMQESTLRNIDYGDRDSLGLFQQRPSQGWGSPEEILDPVYSATRFYEALLEVSGWEELPLTVAAQTVQRSAFPDAYARWEPLATALRDALADVAGADAPTAGNTDSACSSDEIAAGQPIPPGLIPAGYEVPEDAPAQVRVAIRWAMRQLGTPYQWGGDCTDPHGSNPRWRCDCSSLVQQSYAAADVALSRTTFTQFREGTAVDIGAVRPGDLIFTGRDPQRPDHVGLAIGSGLVLHAPGTDDVVRIAYVDDWASQITHVRRVVT
ncbi:C40 family peptidase [Streptomyces hainanensis]|uniref:Peptidoglycan endopeptidase n=1 Tax=Streptomyces hainanensis TaxID=402648 RepID=A0A4V2Y2H9_9ACTN|nr:C40 family peptidase [Streptomyces hainanensis]TDC72615.1 peptidoglycan endopeptidase [Streptomyces hainanensis]